MIFRLVSTCPSIEVVHTGQTNTETHFIFLPDELTTIRPYAFYGNEYLEMLVIPKNNIIDKENYTKKLIKY